MYDDDDDDDDDAGDDDDDDDAGDDDDDDDDAGGGGDDDEDDDDDDDDDLNEPSCTAHKLLHPGTADSAVRNRTVLRFKKRPFGVKRCEPTCLCWMETVPTIGEGGCP